MVDIADPRQPRELSYLYLGIDVYDISVVDGLAYMERSTLRTTSSRATALPGSWQ